MKKDALGKLAVLRRDSWTTHFVGLLLVGLAPWPASEMASGAILVGPVRRYSELRIVVGMDPLVATPLQPSLLESPRRGQ